MKNTEQFFRFARERESVRRLRESGFPPPWTDDRVLQQFRFCNVFREHDLVTKWFRHAIRDPLKDQGQVLMATVAFRWFNTISAGTILRQMLLCRWDSKWARAALLHARDELGTQLFTGAYLIKSPPGVDKVTGICDCIDAVEEGSGRLQRRLAFAAGSMPLQEAHSMLMEFPYLGRFMAYEIVTDLRWTDLLGRAPDINTWASAGPGAARGLGWLHEDNPELLNYNSKTNQDAMLASMRRLLELSRQPNAWPQEWGRWEMREVEHVLCEYDKWRRGHSGQTLKRRFKT